MRLVFLDTETTGLDIDRHTIWEVGAIVREEDGIDHEFHWFLPITITKADPIALDIGKFWDRHPSANYALDKTNDAHKEMSNVNKFCHEFFKLSYRSHIVGAVPDFDVYRIARLMKENLVLPMWNYHLVDVENLLAGMLRLPPPWKWREVLGYVGLNLDDYEQHTALGDARLVRDVYDIVMGENREKIISDYMLGSNSAS